MIRGVHRTVFTLQRILSIAGTGVCLTMFASASQKSDISISTLIDVQPNELLAQPVGANWLSYNGDYSGRRYSKLSEIDRSNVAQLRAQWVFHASQADDMEVTPEVVNGVMFVGVQNDVFALD